MKVVGDRKDRLVSVVIVRDLMLGLLWCQMYGPTTLAPARDYCTLRYTTILEDGNLAVGSLMPDWVDGLFVVHGVAFVFVVW